MSFKKLISICIIIMAAGALWNACSSATPPATGQSSGEPPVRRVVPTVQPTAIVLLAPTGEPVRVQFERGSFGATLTSAASTQYLLWAKAGQTFKASMIGTGYSTLRSVDGATLYEQAWAGAPVTATLGATGDHLLEVRASGQFTVGVEIR